MHPGIMVNCLTHSFWVFLANYVILLPGICIKKISARFPILYFILQAVLDECQILKLQFPMS